MGPLTDDYYHTALIPAFVDFDDLIQRKSEAYVDTLLKGKDEINKEDIMSRMKQFSCKEELERYVESAQEHRFDVLS